LQVVPTLSVETVQWWGGGPYYDYYAPVTARVTVGTRGALTAPGYAPAPGYASGYQAGAADVAYCMERFRSYDPVSRTYMGRDRRVIRVRCDVVGATPLAPVARKVSPVLKPAAAPRASKLALIRHFKPSSAVKVSRVRRYLPHSGLVTVAR